MVGLLNCGVIFEGKLYNSGRWVEEEEVVVLAAAVGEKTEVEELAIWGRYLEL